MKSSFKQIESGKLYQDQLYGDKYLSPLAARIIDTPEFQRLSRIKQLGFADYAYKGAVHTRFSHCVGTYFVTKRLMRKITQNHQRLLLPHPGHDLPNTLSLYPPNSFSKAERDKLEKQEDFLISNHSKWRGLMEVVSIAALLHDIGHVPFGHTLEDEFAGIYERHDNLAGPRLSTLLFNKRSHINSVLTSFDLWEDDLIDQPHLASKEIIEFIYLILSWKEKTKPACGFGSVLDKELGIVSESLKSAKDNPDHVDPEFIDSLKQQLKRLKHLKNIHEKFFNSGAKIFQPFMSDIVGNTICADLLDYLPRDRKNLGMEFRTHTRLQRYLTLRPGTLYDGEGLRLSIMVTRKQRGGQRRDVATAVLDVMRERYELAERVFYHHKKAAASSMLAKLAELSIEQKPKDDDKIYKTSWQDSCIRPTHMIHFDDTSFIEYLGKANVAKERIPLRDKLFMGLRFDRRRIYRTLLVVDSDVITSSQFSFDYLLQDLREDEKGNLSNSGRIKLEEKLAKAAGRDYGDVLVYCPSEKMQAKEVDARLEIQYGRIVPLRCQRDLFTYNADINVIEQYYHNLWQMFVFVDPDIYQNRAQCRNIVECLRKEYRFSKMVLYTKVRNFPLHLENEVSPHDAIYYTSSFLGEGSFGKVVEDIPQPIIASFLNSVSDDEHYLSILHDKGEIDSADVADFDVAIDRRLRQLLEASTLCEATKDKSLNISTGTAKEMNTHISELRANMREPQYFQAASVEHGRRFEKLSYLEYRMTLLQKYGINKQMEADL